MVQEMSVVDRIKKILEKLFGTSDWEDLAIYNGL